MGKFNAQQIEDAVTAYDDKRNEEDDRRYSSYGTYEELHDGETVEIPELGKLEYVDSFGGEGQGDDYWVVFKLGTQLFRKNGWYASYDGGELDGDLHEVKPVQVSVTEYRSV